MSSSPIASAYRYLTDHSGPFRRFRGVVLYWLAARYLRDDPMVFMNYGYAGADAPGLLPDDLPSRAPIELYHRLTASTELEGRRLLEVSSGRGGGASYLMRYRNPASVLGIDRSRRLVEFCRRRHAVPGLTFQQGDAESLELPDESFDVVINVEASHCYGEMARFLNEARRVLRPGGRLLWTDFRSGGSIPQLRNEFRETSWEIQEEEDMSAGVLRAMEAEDSRWAEWIDLHVPRPLRNPFRETAGVRGSRIERALRAGEIRYLRCTLVAAVPGRAG